MPFAFSPNISLTTFKESAGHFTIEEEISKKDWSETIEGGWQDKDIPWKFDKRR